MQFKQGDGTNYTMATLAHLDFNIVNCGSAAQNLTAVVVDFYFLTGTALTSPTMSCYSFTGTGGCTVVSGAFAPFTPKPGADEVMKISFTSGTIAAGGSVDLHTHLFNSTSAGTFDETTFYSYTAADTSYSDSTKITLYVNGALVWGTVP